MPTCGYLKRNGEPCTRKVTGDNYCSQHQRVKEREDAAAQMGSSVSMSRVPPRSSSPTLGLSVNREIPPTPAAPKRGKDKAEAKTKAKEADIKGRPCDAKAPRKEVLAYLKAYPDDVSRTLTASPDQFLLHHYGVQHFLSLLVQESLPALLLAARKSGGGKIRTGNILARFTENYEQENREFLHRWKQGSGFDSALLQTWQGQLFQLLAQLSPPELDHFYARVRQGVPSLRDIATWRLSIEGLSYASLFKTGDSGWFVNWGEVHEHGSKFKDELKQLIISVPSYLFAVARFLPPTRALHLWLESAYFTRKQKLNFVQEAIPKTLISPIGTLQSTLGGCLQFDKKRCKTPNLFSHYVDVRFTFNSRLANSIAAIFDKLRARHHQRDPLDVLTSRPQLLRLPSGEPGAAWMPSPEFRILMERLAKEKSLENAIMRDILESPLYQKAWGKLVKKARDSPDKVICLLPERFEQFVWTVLQRTRKTGLNLRQEPILPQLAALGSGQNFRPEHIAELPNGLFATSLENYKSMLMFVNTEGGFTVQMVYMDVMFLLRFLCYHEPNSLSFFVGGRWHSEMYTEFLRTFGKPGVELVAQQTEPSCQGFFCVNHSVVAPFAADLLGGD